MIDRESLPKAPITPELAALRARANEAGTVGPETQRSSLWKNAFKGRERFFSWASKLIPSASTIKNHLPEIVAGIAASSAVKYATKGALDIAGFGTAPLVGATAGGIMAFGKEYFHNRALTPTPPPRELPLVSEYLQQQRFRRNLDESYRNRLTPDNRVKPTKTELAMDSLNYNWQIIKKTRIQEIAKGVGWGLAGGFAGGLAVDLLSNMPDISKLKLSELSLPNFPSLKMPELPKLPDLKLPDIPLPSLPKFKMPEFKFDMVQNPFKGTGDQLKSAYDNLKTRTPAPKPGVTRPNETPSSTPAPATALETATPTPEQTPPPATTTPEPTRTPQRPNLVNPDELERVDKNEGWRNLPTKPEPVVPSQTLVTPDSLSNSIPLKAGSTLTADTLATLEMFGDRLTEAEKNQIIVEVARQSGVYVPGWTTSGKLHTMLLPGHQLVFNEPVKAMIHRFITN